MIKISTFAVLLTVAVAAQCTSVYDFDDLSDGSDLLESYYEISNSEYKALKGLSSREIRKLSSKYNIGKVSVKDKDWRKARDDRRKIRSRRSRKTGEDLIPSRTRMEDTRSNAASSLPTAAGVHSGPDYSVSKPVNNARIPGTGWTNGGGVDSFKHFSPGWYLPHTRAFSACDPAIHRNCPTPSTPLGTPRGSAGPFPVKVMPNGWWTFHPAFSYPGTADPIANGIVGGAAHHSASHYWNLAHPPAANGHAFAGHVAAGAAYQYVPAAPGFGGFHGFGGLGSPAPAWANPGQASANAYQPDEVNRYPAGAAAGSPNGAAAPAGPYAYAPASKLGSSFMPPHTVPTPKHTGTGGIAPAEPFDKAPTYEVLRAAQKSTKPAVPIPKASTDPGKAPFYATGTKSADPGNAAKPTSAGAKVADKANTHPFSQHTLHKPADKMAKGPGFVGQKPAPAGP